MRSIMLILVAILLLLSQSALAEEDDFSFDDLGDLLIWDEEVLYDQVEWPFPVDLNDMDPDMIRLANQQMLLPEVWHDRGALLPCGFLRAVKMTARRDEISHFPLTTRVVLVQ